MSHVAKKLRNVVSDEVESMLKEEVVFMCPLALSKKCEKIESVNPKKGFTNHHIDGNPGNSKYWNLIRICEQCRRIESTRPTDEALRRQIKLKKKNLAVQYFGPITVNVLRLAAKYGVTCAMPGMAIKLLEQGFVRVNNGKSNPFTVGVAKHVTLQDYQITDLGTELVVNLIGELSPRIRSGDLTPC